MGDRLVWFPLIRHCTSHASWDIGQHGPYRRSRFVVEDERGGEWALVNRPTAEA